MIRKIFLLLVVALAVVWGSLALAQEWKYVGILTSDASADETSLLVEVVEPVKVGRMIVVESRDGKVRETYSVRHVYGHTVILEESLRSAYVSGSKIYQ